MLWRNSDLLKALGM